jgi:hypothetical protein
VVYLDNGILFSLKKKGNSDRCGSMDDPGGHYANRLVTKGQVLPCGA